MALGAHTDRTDVVGCSLCPPGAKGRSARSPPRLRSITRCSPSAPSCSNALFTDYWRSRFGEEGTVKDGEGTRKETAYPLPIFMRDGKFTSHYSLTFIEAAQMAPDVPKLDKHSSGVHRHADGNRVKSFASR